MTFIGDRLVEDGRIDAETLQWALRQQRLHRGYVGEHLIDGGFIKRADLYAALARQWQLSTRDLLRDPPDPELRTLVDPDDTIERGWLACEVTAAGALVVATSVSPSEDLIDEVCDHFPGSDVEFVACTERDLDRFAIGLHAERASRLVASSTPGPVVGTSHLLIATFVVLGALVAALAAPSGWVALFIALASGVCLAAMLAHCLRWISAAPFRWESSDGHGGRIPWRNASELPLYSVLVAVDGGQEGLAGVLDHLTTLDYPTPLLDVVLLVSEADTSTLAAVADLAPHEWVRVIPVPREVVVDPMVTLDLGLARARGRYVVAYAADEIPAPDQLRRAVAAFEADLLQGLGQDVPATPLLGLRVTDRPGTGRSSWRSRVSWLADTADPTIAPEPTSTHFNMRVLRRTGGWQSWCSSEPRPELRVGRLASSTRRSRTPGFGRWVRATAEAQARSPRSALRARPARTVALLGVPLVIGTTLLTAFRDGLGVELLDDRSGRFAVVGLAAVLAGSVLALGVVGGHLVRLRGWLALVDAVLFPAVWLLHATATATALVAVAERRVSGRGGRRTRRSS